MAVPVESDRDHLGKTAILNLPDAVQPQSPATLAQLDAAVSAIPAGLGARTFNVQTAAYTLVLTDDSSNPANNFTFLRLNIGSANNLTVPAHSSVAFPVGCCIDVVTVGAGITTIVGAGGVTVNGTPGLKLRAQYSAATLMQLATDSWIAIGDLSA